MTGLLAAALVAPTIVWAQPCDPGALGSCVPGDIDERRPPIMSAIHEGLGAESLMRLDDDLKTAAAAAGDDESELVAWTSAKSHERNMNDAFNRAISLTEQAYRLTPVTVADPRAKKPASADGAWCEGLSAPWSPRFGSPSYREIIGSDHALHHVNDDPAVLGPDGGVAAMTDPDGRTTIFLLAMSWSSFANDPGLLASAIHHEARHYKDLVEKGWDTHEQGEIRAKTASIAAADVLIPEYTFFGRIPIRKMVTESLRRTIAADEAALSAGRTHSPFASAAQEEEYTSRFHDQQESEKAYDALKARVEARRREDRRQAEDSQKAARWTQFQAWTLSACSYIAGTGPNDPEWGRPDRIRARDEYLRGYLRSHLVVLPPAEIDDGLSRGEYYKVGKLGRCQEQVIEMLRDVPGPVDVDWIMGTIEYERKGGRAGEVISGVIKAVQQAVADGTAALVRTANAPYTGGRASGGGTERGERDVDRGWRRPNSDTPAYRQLRGVSAHGWD